MVPINKEKDNIMGYRSDVLLVLDKNATVNFNEQLKNAPEDIKADVQVLLNAITDECTASTGEKLYYWEWIKWYIEYKSVEFIENFLAKLDEEQYLIVRLGEELTDIEENGAFFDNPFNAGLRQTIEYNAQQ